MTIAPPPPPPPPPSSPPAAEKPARSWVARILRAVVIGVITGVGIIVGIAYLLTGALGPPPPAAEVCVEVPNSGLGELRNGVMIATYCTQIDLHLNLPLGGTDGFEGAFRKPAPPSDPAVPRPGYLDWTSDGCSAPVLGAGPFDFTLACSRHDFGWRNLKAIDGAPTPTWHIDNKDRVDAGFLFDMRRRCAALPLLARVGCDTTARVYYTAVRLNPSGVSGLPGRGG